MGSHRIDRRGRLYWNCYLFFGGRQMQSDKRSEEQTKHKAVALTDGMIHYAEQVKGDKRRATAFLKKAGLLNKEGKLAKEYAA
jgi:hypothetical protein